MLVDELSTASEKINQNTIQTYATAALSGDFDIIINATSIGLSGETLPLADALNCQYAYDMMYGR